MAGDKIGLQVRQRWFKFESPSWSKTLEQVNENTVSPSLMHVHVLITYLRSCGKKSAFFVISIFKNVYCSLLCGLTNSVWGKEPEPLWRVERYWLEIEWFTFLHSPLEFSPLKKRFAFLHAFGSGMGPIILSQNSNWGLHSSAGGLQHPWESNLNLSSVLLLDFRASHTKSKYTSGVPNTSIVIDQPSHH